jgi:ribosome-associated protein
MAYLEMNEEQDYYYEEDDEIEYYAVRPNKTRIKKEIAALFDLGEELSKLSPTLLDTFELPENIRKSVLEVSGMPHKGARKRLLKYIAGQLHKIEVEPILEKLARIKNKSAHGIREHHIAERWRDRLIKGNNEDLAELLDEMPNADSQHLRQLMRNAQKEAAAMKPPKSSRLLYRYLKELLSGHPEELMEAEENQEEDE